MPPPVELQSIERAFLLELDARRGSDIIHYLCFAGGNVLGASIAINGENIVFCGHSGSRHFFDIIVDECP